LGLGRLRGQRGGGPVIFNDEFYRGKKAFGLKAQQVGEKGSKTREVGKEKLHEQVAVKSLEMLRW